MSGDNKCLICNGSGSYQASKKLPVVDCPGCDGTGLLHTCPKCGRAVAFEEGWKLGMGGFKHHCQDGPWPKVVSDENS